MGTKKKVQQQVQPPCSARGPSFFKVMLGNFKRTVRVPPSFTRHIVGKARCGFNLQSFITGRIWHVEVERVGDNLFLHNGWEQFLKDHMIIMGDFLVFDYDGNLGFTIHVYGSDGCEKEIFASDSKDSLSPTGAANMAVHPGEQLSSKSNKELVVLEEDEPLCQGKIPRTIVRSDEALEEAFSFKPENPYFVAAWRQSRGNRMTVPRSFASKHNLRSHKSLSLHDASGRTWPVKVCCRKDGRVELGMGMGSFFRGNNVQDGDVCCFDFAVGCGAVKVHTGRCPRS